MYTLKHNFCTFYLIISNLEMSTLNKRDWIITSTKHVDQYWSKDPKLLLQSSQNSYKNNRFKMNIRKLRQQYDRSQVKTSEPSDRVSHISYFEQNKDQLQSQNQVIGLHKISSQSNLSNKK